MLLSVQDPLSQCGDLLFNCASLYRNFQFLLVSLRRSRGFFRELLMQLLVLFLKVFCFCVGLIERVRLLLKLLLVQGQFIRFLLKNLLHFTLIMRAVFYLLLQLLHQGIKFAPILEENYELLLHKIGYLKYLRCVSFESKLRGAL